MPYRSPDRNSENGQENVRRGLRVLFVEGDPVLLRRLEGDLRACVGPIRPFAVATAGDIRAALQAGSWDAIVVATDAPDEARLAALDEAGRAGVPLVVGSHESIGRSLRRVRRLLDERNAELSRARLELLAREEQLRHAQKMEVLGNFAGGIAHDFNNLVMTIGGYATMVLQDWPAGQRGRADMEEIVRSAERAQALAHQLLGFARKEPLQSKRLELATVIRDVEQLLRRSAGPRVDVLFGLHPGTAPIRADANQLQQVLLNLVLNARDAMPEGGEVRIEVEEVALDAPLEAQGGHVPAGRWVRLLVRDTGIGMDPVTQRRALEPFFTTKPTGRGTGLGLAIVHDVVVRAGGHLRLRSAPGAGTTFEIFFRPDVESSRSNGSHAPHERYTVLLVEDEATLASLVSRLLERDGYDVITATTAEEALALARARLPDRPIHLLLTDVVLPGRNGRELVDDLAALRASVPTLFMSGYADDVIERAGVEMATARILDKPFRPEDLYAAVRDAIAAGAPSL